MAPFTLPASLASTIQSAPLSSTTGLPDNFTRQTAPLGTVVAFVEKAEPSFTRQNAPLSSNLPDNFTRQSAPLSYVAVILVKKVEPTNRHAPLSSASSGHSENFTRQTAPLAEPLNRETGPVSSVAAVPEAEPSIRQSLLFLEIPLSNLVLECDHLLLRLSY